MKRLLKSPLPGIMIVAVILAVGWLVSAPATSGAASGPTIEAVKSDVPAGKARLEVVVRENGKPVAGKITVISSRLDMGPDGMEMMQAPLKPAVSQSPGVAAFDADLSMAGRWALTLTLAVEGRKEPIKGTVVFTATGKRSDAAPAGGKPQKVAYYRNPMGLADVSPVPKKDSMGMDYIPVYESEVPASGAIRISEDKVARAGVRTGIVQRTTLEPIIRAPGVVSLDEGRQGAITIKFSGFVEELLVPATGVRVHAGQPLVRVWIESPEVLQKLADLIALRNTSSFDRATEMAEQNLRVLGIPEPVIEAVKQTGASSRSIILPAPVSGTVIEKPAVPGMRFSPGDTLYKVADLTRMWVVADVPERDLARLRPGQTASIRLKAYDAAAIAGKVTLVYPELDLATRTARARIEVANPDGLLRAGLYADVDISTEAGAAVLAIPSSAVIDDGERRVVFVVKEKGRFEARSVDTGRRAGGLVEVRGGLSEGETVVVKGNFLIDAESNLQAALANLAPAP